MSRNHTCKPFYRPQKWSTNPNYACHKYFLLSKLKIDANTSIPELRKLHAYTNITMLTHFSYSVRHGQFLDSNLTLLLKRAKNLKYLTINLGYGPENFNFCNLFRVIGLLKLKNLKMIYRQGEPGSSTAFLHDLMRLLRKVSTVESLNLKFNNVVFTGQLNSIPRILPLHNLTSLKLGFKEISSNIDKWMISFGKAVGKALYRNLADRKTISLVVAKEACEKLTPLGISKFLACFDQVHLSNQVSLKIAIGYKKDEKYTKYTFGDLFLIFINGHQAKFSLHTLKISSRALNKDLEVLVSKNQTLLMNNLNLLVDNGWTAVQLRQNMNIARHFQPQKGIKIVFPTWIRHEQDPEEYLNEDYEYDEEKEEEYGHLFDIVLTPMLSKITRNNMSVCLDFSDACFDNQDYELLRNVFENTRKHISYLNLILPGQNVDNDSYPNMDGGEMVPAMVKVVCSMGNVTTCVVNVNQLDLKFYNGFREAKKDFTVNKKSSMKKLILRLEKTKMKPKVVLQILRLVGQIPRLESIDVICAEKVYKTCKSAEVIQSKSLKAVPCKFVVE